MMSFEAIVDDTRRTSNDHNISPWANGSGELKIGPDLVVALSHDDSTIRDITLWHI